MSSDKLFKISNPHALEADEVLRKAKASTEGLSDSEAAERLASVGPNRLPEAEKDGLLKRFFKHFHDTLIYILIGAAVITAALGHWIDTIVIMAVVVINAIIGLVQEGKAEQALEGLRKMLSSLAQVRRGGKWREIEAQELVPGDIVRLRSGDRVPADLRLVEVQNLRIEEAALTGESLPVDKTRTRWPRAAAWVTAPAWPIPDRLLPEGAGRAWWLPPERIPSWAASTR